VGVKVNTPFHLDSSGQMIAAALVLRCVEEGRLSLDDSIGKFQPSSPDASATIRQVLSHTTAGPSGLTFLYRPERLDALAAPISNCTGPSYRGPVAALTITPGGGLLSTVRDLVHFDLALRQGVLLRANTLALAWSGPLDGNGRSLPHGLGWFVQSYGGEPVVWQFGVGDNASSSMILTLPRRGLTLIVLANSQGLVRPFPLASGDVTASPFARLFLGLYVR
jgi:CubicO group peptidase (beta-lactamase class C family)